MNSHCVNNVKSYQVGKLKGRHCILKLSGGGLPCHLIIILHTDLSEVSTAL